MQSFDQFGKLILLAGVTLIVVGLIVIVVGKLGGGQLPGDFVFKWGRGRVYFPIVTSIIASIILTLLLNLVIWLTRR